MTMVVAALPAALIWSRSASIRSWPAFTWSPALTWAVNGAPFSSTVSMPMWRRTSHPASDIRPSAWPVLATRVISPSHGA